MLLKETEMKKEKNRLELCMYVSSNNAIRDITIVTFAKAKTKYFP